MSEDDKFTMILNRMGEIHTEMQGFNRTATDIQVTHARQNEQIETLELESQSKSVEIKALRTKADAMSGAIRVFVWLCGLTSVSTLAASASQTDYVYLCSGTMTLTLPDATASNTNLYTIKNVGSGTVTVNTTSAQTIDGNLTITMPVQYTSIDVISDTANWGIT